jgi:hypothetical protein
LELRFGVVSLGETIVELLGATSEDDDQVNPALGEEVAGMPIEYQAAARRVGFQGVQKLIGRSVRFGARMTRSMAHLVLIDNPRLQFLVVSVVASPLLRDLIDRDVLKTGGSGELLGVGRLADTRSAGDDDIGRLAHVVRCVEGVLR